MANVNRVVLMGRVGKEPEIRRTSSGTPVASFSMATSDSWKDKATGEKKEKTEWHNVVVWGNNDGGGLPTAVIEPYVHKGDLLYIEGALATRKWTDKEGHDKYTTEVVLKGPQATLQLMPKGSSGAAEGAASRAPVRPAQAPAQHAPAQHDDLMDDAVPF